jgi:RsiW-degrading membrane proteinase PrsW (M82 family)
MSLPKPPKLRRRWLGRKGGLLIAGVLIALWLFYALREGLSLPDASGAVPTAILLGGFAVGTSFLYTMAYRLNPRDGISPMRLVLAFVVGGLFATTFASVINPLINLAGGGTLTGEPTLLALSLAGVVEELMKILLVIVMARGLANKSARNGLFLGGAVGFGFAAFEDMDYEVRAAHSYYFADSHLVSYIVVSIERGLLGPLGHPIFTALFAAALFAATRNGRYRITIGVIGAYLGVAAMHGLFDASGNLIDRAVKQDWLAGWLGLAATVVISLASGVVWLIVTRRLRNRARVRDAPPPPPGASPYLLPPPPGLGVAAVAPGIDPSSFTPPS